MTNKPEEIKLAQRVIEDFQQWHYEKYGVELGVCDDFIEDFANGDFVLTYCCDVCFAINRLTDDCVYCGARV